MIVCGEIGQWVKIEAIQAYEDFGLPAGNGAEVVDVYEQDGQVRYDVQVLGTDKILHGLGMYELTEMSLKEIGQSPFFSV